MTFSYVLVFFIAMNSEHLSHIFVNTFLLVPSSPQIGKLICFEMLFFQRFKNLLFALLLFQIIIFGEIIHKTLQASRKETSRPGKN